MDREAQVHSTQSTIKNPPTTTKKWYHLKLFPKFAIIFFLVVALPVVVIAVYVSYQSRVFILESLEQFIRDITSSVETIAQEQQVASESVLDSTNQELSQLSEQSLLRIKGRLLQLNKNVYADNIEKFASESQAVLEEKLQLLNNEVSQEVGAIINDFVEESRMAMKTLVDNMSGPEFSSRREEQFREVLSHHGQFVHLRFLDSLGLNTVLVTREVAFYKESDPAFTAAEPYFSSAFSGKEQVIDGLTEDGIPLLRLLRPVRTGTHTEGVVFGVASFLPVWEQIQTRFFHHGEQIYILNAQGTLVYPIRGTPVSPAMKGYLQTVSDATESQGMLQQEDMLLLYKTLSVLNWRIVVVQPKPSIETRIAPIHLMVSDYMQRIEEQVQTALEEEVKLIAYDMSEHIEEKKETIRKDTADRRVSFHKTIVDQVTTNINLVAVEVYKRTIRNIIPIIIGIGLFAAAVGIFVAACIIRPIKGVTAVAYKVSHGDVSQAVPAIHSHDEIGLLSQSFEETTHYLRSIVKGAQKISEGDFTDEVLPISEKDALGVAFRNMTAYLRDIAALATNISRGDLSQVVTPKSEVDVLGLAIHRMTVYLERIVRVAKKVAGGNLSENSQPQSENDFLGNAFAEMILKLRFLVSKIRTDANQLVSMSQESQARAQEEADSVEKISLSVEETSTSMTEMAMSIGEVNESMQGLASFVGETMSSIEEMTSSIKQIVLHSEQLASASEETSVSIQQISASLQEIAGTAQHSKMLSDGARQDAIAGREAVEKMIQSMKIIQQMVTVTAEAIQLLNKRTESIETILEVIKDISEQTSLLSINASIISKKAGARGRGFNVIADKVRKLAEQSSSSAKEIAMIIRDVRKEAAHAVEVVSMGNEKVEEGVTLAELAGKALDKIILGANESSTVVAKIAETTEEQTKIGQHIMESMDQVVEMVDQIKRATKEQEKSSSFIMKQAEQILLSSEQVKQSTLEQTEVVTHVSLAMDNIRGLIQMTSERAKAAAESASMLAQHAHALKQLVSQFTI
jgi:methyl-accepting chemotaxis protein